MRIDGANGGIRDYVTISKVAREKAMSLQKEKTQSTLLHTTVEKTAQSNKKVAKEFEAMFLGEVLKKMQDTVPENELFGGGQAEKVFTDMLMEEYARKTADEGSLGLARNIIDQIDHMDKPSAAKGQMPPVRRKINIQA